MVFETKSSDKDAMKVVEMTTKGFHYYINVVPGFERIDSNFERRSILSKSCATENSLKGRVSVSNFGIVWLLATATPPPATPTLIRYQPSTPRQDPPPARLCVTGQKLR